MQDSIEVKMPREILVRDKKVNTITVRMPTVEDELRAGEMSRFQTPTGFMQTDQALQELHIISAVTDIPTSQLKKMRRMEYALLSEAVGKLEMSVMMPVTPNEESK